MQLRIAEGIHHGEDGTLCHGRGLRIVDIGNQEPLIAFFETVECVTGTVAIQPAHKIRARDFQQRDAINFPNPWIASLSQQGVNDAELMRYKCGTGRQGKIKH